MGSVGLEKITENIHVNMKSLRRMEHQRQQKKHGDIIIIFNRKKTYTFEIRQKRRNKPSKEFNPKLVISQVMDDGSITIEMSIHRLRRILCKNNINGYIAAKRP